MSDYIKKNDVRRLLLHNDREAALAKLDELEAVDAVPVVRCKNCRYNPKRDWVSCPMTGRNTRKDDDFCSYGEEYSRC